MSPMDDYLDKPLREVLVALQSRYTTITKYFDVLTQRVPFDHWSYQEIITDTDPDVIIEVGVYCGGHALALAHLCDIRGKGRVIAVEPITDRIHEKAKAHPRITIVGDYGPAAYPKVAAMVAPDEKAFVIEDSSHEYGNTLEVLRNYSKLVKPGGYIVCEDTICYHGLSLGPNPGPWDAVMAFVAENKNFAIDRDREFPITWNPCGFLKRVS